MYVYIQTYTHTYVFQHSRLILLHQSALSLSLAVPIVREEQIHSDTLFGREPSFKKIHDLFTLIPKCQMVTRQFGCVCPFSVNTVRS